MTMKKHASFSGARLLLCLLALILFGCSAAAYLLDTRISESTYAYVGKHTSGVGQLTENAVTQTFTATENHLAAVEVMYSNYNKKPQSGTLTLRLLDSEGLERAGETYEVAELRNNAFIRLPLTETQNGSAGRTYTLHAVSDCTDGKGVTLRMGARETDAPAGVLTLADGMVDEENFLNLRAVYTTVSYGWQGCYVLAALGVCALLCLPLAGKERKHA